MTVLHASPRPFRARHQQEQVAARLDHITNALGDLSQDARGIAFDIGEIKTGHGPRLERIESTLTGHGELLRAILARLGGKPEQGSGG
jgi:hypothetical protein